MKIGEVVGGYEVVTEPTNQDGGKCVWAFARKDGKEYFLKQFLDPKWPLDSAPGDAASKAQRRKNCREFEQRHRRMMDRMKNDVPGGGNVVVTDEFFREGSTYFKVTERIEAAGLGDLTGLTPKQQAVVLRTLALSVRQLHNVGLVHGDLKPTNILIQRRPGSDLYTAKLIDFDDSYFAGEPPVPDLVVGDPDYAAPEWLRYVSGDESVTAADITPATDMFALGLVVHEYLTGERIGFDGRFGTRGDAVAAGGTLLPAPKLGPYLSDLVLALTQARPQHRLTAGEFFEALASGEVLDPGKAAWSTAFRSPRARRWSFNPGDGKPAPTSRTPAAPSPPPAAGKGAPASRPASPGTSRVRIRLDDSSGS